MNIDYNYAKFDNKKLYYAQVGNGKQVTVFILGWLSNIDSFPIKELVKPYKNDLKNQTFIFVHLSNHYKSSLSNKPFTVDLYTKELTDFIKYKGFKKVNVVAHSAGGRYAIKFASTYTNKINKLILFSPAGLSNKKAKQGQLNKVRWYFNKSNLKTNKQKNILEKTFSNVYGTNLKNELSKIKCQTLIIWGTKDTTTPYKRAKILTNNINSSLLYTLKNKGHMIIKDKQAFYYAINFITEDSKVTDKLIKLSKQNKINSSLTRYKYNYLRVNPSYKARKLFTVFISKNNLKEIGKEYMHLESSLNKLCKFMLKTNNKDYKEFLNLQGIDFRALSNLNPSTLYNYARIDSIYTGTNTKLIEFNARRPQMFEDVDWFNQYYKAFGIGKKPKHKLTDKIVQSIKTQNKGKGKGNNIILISDFNKKSKYSFYNRLKNNFSNASIYKWTTGKSAKNISSSSLVNNKLVINNIKIDHIIVQSLGVGKKSFFYNNGKIVNKNVRQAYFSNNLQISSPLTSSVFGRKQSLQLLQDAKVQKKLKLSKSEISAINKLPKTKEFVSVNQINKDYVVKIQGLGSGKGVYFFKDIGNKEKDLFKKVAKKEKHNILLQEKIEPVPVKIYNLNTLKPVIASVSLEPFIVHGKGKSKIIDYTARAIPYKHIENISKFNPVFNKPNIWFGGVVEY